MIEQRARELLEVLDQPFPNRASLANAMEELRSALYNAPAREAPDDGLSSEALLHRLNCIDDALKQLVRASTASEVPTQAAEGGLSEAQRFNEWADSDGWPWGWWGDAALAGWLARASECDDMAKAYELLFKENFRLKNSLDDALAASAPTQAEPVAAGGVPLGWIETAEGGVQRWSTTFDKLPDGAWALTATQIAEESTSERCRVCGGLGSLDVYTTAAAPSMRASCFACGGNKPRCPSPEGCDANGCGGDCLTNEEIGTPPVPASEAPTQAGGCQASAACTYPNCDGDAPAEDGCCHKPRESCRSPGAGCRAGEHNSDCWATCGGLAPAAPPAGRTLTEVVNSMPTTWELSWGSEDEESPGSWRVHECSGSRSDREWRLIGEGPNPTDAILAASSTTAGTQPSEGE